MFARLLAIAAAIFVAWAILWSAGGWHFTRKPTADELYGCAVDQQAPNGECE